MKVKTALTESLVAAMFFLPMTFAANTTTNTDIKADMNVISQNYTTLGKQIDDPNMNASSKEIIDRMIASSRDAAAETPARAQELKGSAKVSVTEKYKTEMNTFVARLEDMKMRLDSQDNKGAREIYNGLQRWTKPQHSAPYK